MQGWESGTLDQVVSLFDDCGGMQQNILNIDKELQFNSWLFEGIKKELVPHGFQVEPSQLNKAIVPNVCEYSNNISNCVIYHPNTLHKTNIDALAIVIHVDSSESDSDVNIDDVDDELVKIIVSGSTFEMKIDKINQAAINECINDMFGTGTRLAMWGLTSRESANIWSCCCHASPRCI